MSVLDAERVGLMLEHMSPERRRQAVQGLKLLAQAARRYKGVRNDPLGNNRSRPYHRHNGSSLDNRGNLVTETLDFCRQGLRSSGSRLVQQCNQHR